MAARDSVDLNSAETFAPEGFYSGILPQAQPTGPGIAVRVAQATASAPPATLVVELEDGNIARLPAGADISNVSANGADLQFVQPDGRVIVIPGGAIANLVLFVGDIQIPAEAVAQIFATNDIQTAAGPEGGNTTPNGASGNFSDPGEQSVGDGFRQNSLLSDTNLPGAGVGGEDPPASGNARPVIVSILGGNVSEEGLSPLGLKDTNGIPGDTTDSATLTGTVVVTDDGGPLTFSFGIPAGTFTSGGLPIAWTAAGGTLIGTVGAPAVTVFTATISATGAWTVTLSGPFDHPIGGSEDTLSLLLPITVTDTGGLSASGVLPITIEDDSPRLADTKPASLLIDEDDIDTSGSLGSAPNDGNGDGSYTGTPGVNTGGPANASGSLADLVNSGADGGLTYGFVDDAQVRGFMEAQGLKSEGAELSYQVVGNVLYGFANQAGPHGVSYDAPQDRLVFTLEVAPDTGAFTFSLYDQLDHDKPAHDASLPIDFGETLQATDFDKDPVSLSGMVTVHVTDDVPYLSGKGTSLTVDEDDIRTNGSLGSSPNDGNADGSFTGQAGVNNPGPANATGTLAGLVATSGADDELTYGFRADADVRIVMEAQNLKSEGALLSYQVVGNVLYGFANQAGPHGLIYNAGQDRLVFTLELTPTTGSYTFSLHDQLDHLGANNANLSTIAIKFGEALQAIDFDGDPVTLTGKVTVNVADDVPVLSGATTGLTVDEDDIRTDPSGSLGSSPNDGNGDGSYTGQAGVNNPGPANATGSLAGLVAASGADDPVTYGFLSDTAVRTFMLAQNLKSEGEALSYQVVDNTLYGFVNFGQPGTVYNDNQDRLVFTLEVNPTSGAYTFSLHDQLDHDKQSHDSSLPIDFGGALQALDFDKDGVTLTGKVTVTVTDDVPYLSGQGTTLTVDEDDIRTGGSLGSSPNDGNGDGSYTGPASDNAAGPANATGTLSGLATSGADDPITYGFLSDTAVRAFMTTQGLTSEGKALSYQVVGDTLYAFDNLAGPGGLIYDQGPDRLVFTLVVNPATGAYTFSLYDQLDHTKNGQGASIPIDFGGALQAIDFDKDAVTLTGKVTVNVTDDVPSATGETRTVQEDIGPFTIDLDANDSSGSDDPISITVTGVSATAGTNVLPWNPTSQEWTLLSGNVFSISPPANFNGAITIQYQVKDFDGDIKTATATINVGAVNDAPVITSGASAPAQENAPASTVVYNTDAVDPDNPVLTYSLASGGDNDKFNINSTTGEVTFKVSPNFEAPTDAGANNVYDITVRASDGTLTTTKAVAITVTDVNETPSAGADFQVNAAENVSDTAVLADVNGTDPDTGGGNDASNTFENLTYSIFADASNKFEINASTGEISLKTGQTLDFETAQQHVITVRTTDGGGLTDDVQVTIKVTDVNEAPPLVPAGESIVINNDGAQIPEWLLLLNDVGAVDVADGEEVSDTGVEVAHTNGGNGTGYFTFDEEDGPGGSFNYRVRDAIGNLSDAAGVTASVIRDTNGSLDGTGSSEIIFGFTSNDDLRGGGGNDTYAFRATGDGRDTIDDTSGTADRIVIGTNGTALSTLSFERDDEDLEIDYGSQVSIEINNHYGSDNTTSGTGTIETLTFVGGTSHKGYQIDGSPYLLNSVRNGTTDVINGTTGNDIIADSDGERTLNGGDGNDLLFGNGDDDTLNGGNGNDFLSGGDDDDILIGGADNDVLFGGDGSDTLTGGSGNDRFVMSTTNSADTITAGDYVFSAGAGQGDVFDLSELLDANFGGNSSVSNFARLSAAPGGPNTDMLLQVRTDGSGNWDTVAVLDNYDSAGNQSVKVFFEGIEHTLTTLGDN